MRYRLTLEPDDNDTALVTSPDLPIVTFGEDEADALRRADDAAMAILQSMMDHREPPPPPCERPISSPVLRLSLQTTLKLRLHGALLDQGLTRADLQRRLGWKRGSADRLFRLDHASRLAQLEQAFEVLGREVAIEVTAATRDAA